MKESRPGMVTDFTSSQEALIDPTAKSESPAPSSVLQRASAAAIFIGCCSTMIWPCQWPDTTTARPATSTEPSAKRKAGRKVATVSALSARRARCHAETASTKPPATSQAPAMTCGKVASAVTLPSIVQMLLSSARPLSGLKRTPTGCCMKELAARMK
jgi:hypothetical protein